MINILVWILFGAIIGLIAGWIMKTKKGWIACILVGIVGALLGGWIMDLIPVGPSVDVGPFNLGIVNILVSIAGACLLIFILRKLKIIK